MVAVEGSTSIYTTQGLDLIWETDLHPRTRGRRGLPRAVQRRRRGGGEGKRVRRPEA